LSHHTDITERKATMLITQNTIEAIIDQKIWNKKRSR